MRFRLFESHSFRLIILFQLLALDAYGGDQPVMQRNQSDMLVPGKGEMVFVPGGAFVMGSSEEEISAVRERVGKRGDFLEYDFGAEKPRRAVNLKGFYIDRHEVTNAKYKKFIDAADHPPPPHWKAFTFPAGKDEYPVIRVSYFDALAYAKWAGKRLPSEEEWEKAARGTDGRVYPWGNDFDPDRSGTAEAVLRTRYTIYDLGRFAAPVGAFPGDISPYGVVNMTGNVMEWTSSWFKKGNSRVVKGAAWVNLGQRGRSASRIGVEPDGVSHIMGFRCAKDAE